MQEIPLPVPDLEAAACRCDGGQPKLQAWSLTLAKNREIIGMFLGRVAELTRGPTPASVGSPEIASARRRGGDS